MGVDERVGVSSRIVRGGATGAKADIEKNWR